MELAHRLLSIKMGEDREAVNPLKRRKEVHQHVLTLVDVVGPTTMRDALLASGNRAGAMPPIGWRPGACPSQVRVNPS